MYYARALASLAVLLDDVPIHGSSDVLCMVLAICLLVPATPGLAQPEPAMLSGNGRYGAITINGVVLSVQDVQQLLAAGLLQLDPATRRFSIGAGLSSEARFTAALRQVPLSNPQAPRDLYRSSKVAVPLREQRAR